MRFLSITNPTRFGFTVTNIQEGGCCTLQPGTNRQLAYQNSPVTMMFTTSDVPPQGEQWTIKLGDGTTTLQGTNGRFTITDDPQPVTIGTGK